ncbi:hypothetical protein [Candidatus Nitrospira salsa]
MEYSAPLPKDQIVREKRTFYLDEVFKEGGEYLRNIILDSFYCAFQHSY